MVLLNNTWILWFHDPNDSNWKINSYKKIANIKSIEEYWGLYEKLSETVVQKGMFFLMREGILPIWEDEKNKDGGCWSFKIGKKDIYNAWVELSISLLGETIMKELQHSTTITGISLSPKKNFSIIKIWNNSSDKNKSNLLSRRIPHLYICDSIYKAHKDKN